MVLVPPLSVRVPDAVRREAKRSGAPLIWDRLKGGIWNGPGSAAHHCALSRLMLRRARETCDGCF